jgi:hypothetical protein
LEGKTKKPHELLSARRPLRKEALYLWNWWLEIRAEQGPQGIVNARAMQDWEWLTGNRLNILERRIIQALESTWRSPG